MSDLAATAQRLRDVKEAMRHFLELWALEQDGDVAAVEAAIRQELDVSISESLVRGVLAEE
jgi:hypothetical protein